MSEPDDNPQVDPVASRWLSRLLPYIVTAVALALTLFAAATVRQQAIARDRARFDQAVNSLVVDVQDRLKACTNILRGVASRITSGRLPISRLAFQNYVAGLDLENQYPGIQGVGYARRIKPGEEDDLTSDLTAEGISNFRIESEAGSTSTPEAMFPIVYIEPEDARNLKVRGFDMFSHPTRRDAMLRAAISGQPTASGRVILRQETEPTKQAGLLLYCPIYRGGQTTAPLTERWDALEGFAYCPLRARDLLEGVFADEPTSLVTIQVFDGNQLNASSLLYQSALPTSGSPLHTHEVHINVAGQPWSMYFASTRDFNRGSNRNEAWYILAAGLGVSLVLFLLTRAEARAREVAERTNDRLRRSQQRLQLLNNELALARDQALEASRAKSAFLANMSHELRTPLNAIIGYAELLEEELPDECGGQTRQDLQKIRSAGDHLLELVSGVLDLAKIEAGRLELEFSDIQLQGVLDEAVAVVEPLIAHNRNEISVDCPPGLSLTTDRVRLRQILINLVGNAAKFTEDGRITVTAAHLPNDRTIVAIEVRDTGIGMELSQQGRLFENFQQADTSATRKHGGTGLGLAISRRLARALGGDIIVRSEYGRGSSFTLRIPILPNESVVETTQSEHSA